LPSVQKEKDGLVASVVCAVDLIKGIGLCAGIGRSVSRGRAGTSTQLQGKLEAAIREFEKGKDWFTSISKRRRVRTPGARLRTNPRL
jgi:2,3-bisphosphoglycerate-independent phosphoglycerate mutase